MENFIKAQQSHLRWSHISQQPFLHEMEDEEHSIAIYLNQQVFYHPPLDKNQQISDHSQQKNNYRMNKSCPELQKSSKKPKLSLTKSIFHNFQKHLITMIKKYMSISKSKLSSQENGAVAGDLWLAFMKSNSFNKRLLHIAFGVDDDNISRESAESLSHEFQEFQRVSRKYGHERIAQAQKILRSNVVDQAQHLSKQFLKANSNIIKFDEFYAYFSHFIRQIQEGPMSKRMRKSSKEILVQNLKDRLCAQNE